MWDKPLVEPHFDNSTKTTVVAGLGQTAELHCRVNHLGDRAVTWLRRHDVHVLTVGLFPYTTDDRFSAHRSEDSDEWTLRIASVKVGDSGIYECQVSTEPKISKSFRLQVIVSQAHIDGPKEIHMVSGSNINLTCTVTGNPDPPQYIYWSMGSIIINYSSRGGISIVTDKKSRTSRLVVTRATIADSGNYTCAPANAEPATVSVYILNGEHPEAMQGGESTGAHCQSLILLIVLGILAMNYGGFAIR
ncbi:protein amalgam-like [Oratosquilla oratoria]|uniref:protein amalgam-like n=1 Tax=Oratosquilla oratoria TaxID=337810 RepID=UPI003F768DE0